MGSFTKCFTDVLSLSQAMAEEDLTGNLGMDLQEAVQQSASEVVKADGGHCQFLFRK